MREVPEVLGEKKKKKVITTATLSKLIIRVKIDHISLKSLAIPFTYPIKLKGNMNTVWYKFYPELETL